MKPYSKDLRLKVLAAVDRGMPRKEVARVFGVSEPTIRRYLRLRRQTGDVEPRPLPGPPARKREAREIVPERFVFVDECGTHTSMTRLYARAPRGERAYGKVPRNRGPNTTLLASMSVEGMGPCLAVEGPTTKAVKAVFEAYVERVL